MRDLLQKIFTCAVANLESVRQPAAKLDQVVIQKYRPGLKRTHHGRAIDLHEDVVLQIKSREEFERPIHQVLSGIAFPQIDRLRIEIADLERALEHLA